MKDNELTRRAAVGLAAGAALTLAAGERWVFAARDGDVVKTPGDAAAWRPVLLDEREAEGLARLVDALIPRTTTPGARDARVHEYIDLSVSLAPVEEKKAFVDGLRWLDRRSEKAYGADLATVESADLVALLHSISDEHEDPPKSLQAGHSLLRRSQAPHHLRLLHLDRGSRAGARAARDGFAADLARLPAPGRAAHHLVARRRGPPRCRFTT